MMSLNHIENTKLPLELDFKDLKSKGLAYIQEHSSTQWSNLNPSDPGVTILEQLCYAFTELGYCSNFSIQDILTTKTGDLQIEDQFYLPENILTTSPITVNDYIKYIIDHVSGIKNVVINPISSTATFVNGLYEVFLQVDTTYANTTQINNPVLDTFFVVNTVRNLGETFLMPKVLQEKNYSITGGLLLKKGFDVHTVIATIIEKINTYVFPPVVATGYDKLNEDNISTNAIFNGPKLENGWIPTSSIQQKKDTIQLFEIVEIIQSVAGVSSCMDASFIDASGEKQEVASCSKSEILVFDFLENQRTPSSEGIDVYNLGKPINEGLDLTLISELKLLQNLTEAIDTVAAIQMQPELPISKFRDIESYYSIQNTFPDIYAVGLNAVNEQSSVTQIAQSRQLKGYLTLFDQLLANQFSQLANLGQLFSFKNAQTADPVDQAYFYNTKDKNEQEQLTYPEPFQSFSPTYFYQSLYKSVPNMQPLLKNNTVFNFSHVYENHQELERKSWEEYQTDPYNSYIYGLMQVMENEDENLDRRNAILNHLLARHGVSPLCIDNIIQTNVYTGNESKDQILLKSLYLQNLGILSYYRTKAYDVLSASKLPSITVFLKLPNTLKQLKLAVKDISVNSTAIQFFIDKLSGEISTEFVTILESFIAKKEEKINEQTNEDIIFLNKQLLKIVERLTELNKILSKEGELIPESITTSYSSIRESICLLEKLIAHPVSTIFNSELIAEQQKLEQQDFTNYNTIDVKLSLLFALQKHYKNYLQEGIEEKNTWISKYLAS